MITLKDLKEIDKAMSDMKEMDNPQPPFHLPPATPPTATAKEVSEALHQLRGYLAGPIDITLNAHLGLGDKPKFRWTITAGDQWTGDTLASAVSRAIDDALARLT